MVAAALKDPETGLTTPGPVRTFSTSPEATRITPYGPEGTPGMIPPVVGMGTLPVVGVGAPGVTVGRLTVGVETVGMGEAIVGMARSGVGEGMMIRVGNGVGVPSNEIEQPVRATSKPRRSRARIVFITISPLNRLIVSPPLPG